MKFNIPMLKLDDSELTYNNNGVVSHWVIDDPSDDFNTVGFVSDYFNQQCRVQCKRYNEKFTPYEFWSRNKRRIIDECSRKYGLSYIGLTETIYNLCKGCTTFRPKLLSSFINEFKPKSILDISSGWGDRLIAALACDVEYLGCDPNSCLHPGYRAMIKKFAKDRSKFKVIHDKFQNARLPPKLFDMVFTSPPYFDVEVYSKEPTQSIEEFNTVDKWFEGFLKPSLDKAWKHLSVGGLMVLHINNTPGKPDYVLRMRDYINTFADAEYLGIIGKVTSGDSRARPIWIWRKVHTGSSDSLCNEYEQWLRSQRIRDIIPSKHQTRYYLEQLIERWFLVNINKTSSHLLFSEDADDMFMQTCREKNLMKVTEAEEFLEQMKKLLHERVEFNEDLTITTEQSNNEYTNITTFKCGKFSFTLTTDRVEALRKYSTADNFEKQLVICALRYASVFAYDRQWCAGLNIYQDAVNAGATIEAMASPFNAQILRTDAINPKYCSLFPDIESSLGSIGSFFETKFENTHLVVNPPRVEEVINKTVEYCLEQNNCTFTMVLPKWRDSKFYEQLLIAGATIEPLSNYYSEDPFTGEVKNVVKIEFVKVTLKT